MTDNRTLEERVLQARLTPNEKRIYDYIMGQKEQAAFMTSTAIAAAVEVGDTSVIRLSRTLGFESFKAFHRALQQEVLSQRPETGATHLPYEKLQRGSGLEAGEIPALVRHQFLQRMEADKAANGDEKYLDAAKLLVGAQRKFIAGYRNTAGLANYLVAQLSHILPDVRQVNRLDGYEDVALDMGRGDVLVLLSLPRYSGNALMVRRIARERQCPVIVLTDKATAPVAQGAAKVFVSGVESVSYANSVSGLVLSLEILISLVGKLSGDQGQKRLQALDAYLCESGQF